MALFSPVSLRSGRAHPFRSRPSNRDICHENQFLHSWFGCSPWALQCSPSPAAAQEVCDVAGSPSGTATGTDSLAAETDPTRAVIFRPLSAIPAIASGSEGTAVGHAATRHREPGDRQSVALPKPRATIRRPWATMPEHSVPIPCDWQWRLRDGFRGCDRFQRDATGPASIALGISSEATGDNSTAMGYYAAQPEPTRLLSAGICCQRQLFDRFRY